MKTTILFSSLSVAAVLLLSSSTLFAHPPLELLKESPFTVFSKVNESTGVTASSLINNNDHFAIGQAWGDANADGWLDLYLTDASGSNSLYLNQQDGTFALSDNNDDVALPLHESAGAAFADYNNDGFVDLYVAGLAGDHLFQNQGGAGFLDVTDFAGVGDLGWGQSVTWGDVNKDGFLDLYVTNWACEDCPDSSRDSLYLNNGNGTFQDVSAVLGSSAYGPGLAVTMLDYDNDGDSDIYVVNDKLWGNVLFRNDGVGCGSVCLTDVSAAAGADTEVWGMGIAVGDYDNDLDLDLYFSNIGPPVLLQNQTSQGSPTFVPVTHEAGVDFDGVSWGAVFFDVDNDSLLDAYLTISMSAGPFSAEPRLYRNLGTGGFSDISQRAAVNDSGFTMGIAYADYDRDGLLDYVIGNRDGNYNLYRNMGGEGTAGNSWLSIKLNGAGGINRDAVGSRVYLYTESGEIRMQEVKAGSSYCAGNQLELHFGLGQEEIDRFEIVWPDGTSTVCDDVDSNQYVEVLYDVDTPGSPKDCLLTEGGGAGGAALGVGLSSEQGLSISSSPIHYGQRQLSGGESQFIDISITGESVVLGDDLSSQLISLETPVPFYGDLLRRIRMSSNGYLTSDVADLGFDLTNDCDIPAGVSTGGGARIYPLHDDLVTGAGYHQYFDICPRALDENSCLVGCHVFHWADVEHYPSSESFEFEALLYTTGDIVYLYRGDNEELGSGSTTGIQGVGGAAGVLCSCDEENSLSNDTAIHIFSDIDADETPDSSLRTCESSDEGGEDDVAIDLPEEESEFEEGSDAVSILADRLQRLSNKLRRLRMLTIRNTLERRKNQRKIRRTIRELQLLTMSTLLTSSDDVSPLAKRLRKRLVQVLRCEPEKMPAVRARVLRAIARVIASGSF